MMAKYTGLSCFALLLILAGCGDPAHIKPVPVRVSPSIPLVCPATEETQTKHDQVVICPNQKYTMTYCHVLTSRELGINSKTLDQNTEEIVEASLKRLAEIDPILGEIATKHYKEFWPRVIMTLDEPKTMALTEPGCSLVPVINEASANANSTIVLYSSVWNELSSIQQAVIVLKELFLQDLVGQENTRTMRYSSAKILTALLVSDYLDSPNYPNPSARMRGYYQYLEQRGVPAWFSYRQNLKQHDPQIELWRSVHFETAGPLVSPFFELTVKLTGSKPENFVLLTVPPSKSLMIRDDGTIREVQFATLATKAWGGMTMQADFNGVVDEQGSLDHGLIYSMATTRFADPPTWIPKGFTCLAGEAEFYSSGAIKSCRVPDLIFTLNSDRATKSATSFGERVNLSEEGYRLP